MSASRWWREATTIALRWVRRGLLALGATMMAAPATILAFGHHGQLDVQSGAPIKIEYHLLKEGAPSGFFPVRMEVTNNDAKAHQWAASFETNTGNRTFSLRTNAMLGAGAGEKRVFDLLVPRGTLGSDYGRDAVTLRVAGYGIESRSHHLAQHYGGGRTPTAYILMSQTIAASEWTKLETELQSGTRTITSSALDARFPGGRSTGRRLAGSRAELAELPADQGTLHGVAAIWLTTADWQALPAALRAVIRQWIIAGGRLFVGFEDPNALLLRGLPGDGRTTEQIVGLGRIIPMAMAKGELPVREAADQFVALDSAPLPQWQTDFEGTWAPKDFVGWPSLNVPLIIGFVVLFALVIGPINLMKLAPEGRRHRLFVTVPALSAVASVLLLAIIVAGDGFGGAGARNAFVLLMAGENQASIAQEQVVRTRLLLSRGFSLPPEAAFAFVPLQKNAARIATQRTGDQLGGDWFRSRALQAHTLRLNAPTRAEVVLDKTSRQDAPVLLSTLGAPLRSLHYLDAGGNYWSVAELPTGRPTPLKPATRSEFENWLNAVRESLTPSLGQALSELSHRPGWFYAEGAPPGVAPIATLRSVNWQRETIITAGSCEPLAGK